ncbi:PKD domain-containing protein [Gryllotalpicola reticulitermitis]|uniref:PKD domain-containing protein n=1 Tax=Gryllotalpicola reticulitermitis TaxID=1184153 RepID=A0ABV8Q9P0_9MICO
MASGPREHSQSGQLLGQAVTVRFTPVAYHWSYGDGSARSTPGPGVSWKASGLSAFAKTSTSHVFTARGSYPVTVAVEYAAQYRFAGDGWRAIPGTLSLTSGAVTVTVKAVKTVLVGGTCDEKPSAPGCSL